MVQFRRSSFFICSKFLLIQRISENSIYLLLIKKKAYDIYQIPLIYMCMDGFFEGQMRKKVKFNFFRVESTHLHINA